jgi:regulator of sigma E protease
MLTLGSFLLALILLIAVHEYGHYRMAVACGVKVLRFSIGFGKNLYRWTPKGSATEFVISAFPLGGYVKMLDECEGVVPPEERHRAFNTQALRARVAIVAAGPLANLVLAVVLYSLVSWIGVEQAAPVLAHPRQGTVAAQAGLIGGERILKAGLDGSVLQDVESFERLRWFLAQAALTGQNVRLLAASAANGLPRDFLLKIESLKTSEPNAEFFEKIGLTSPFSRPILGDLLVGGAAEKAGLLRGDVVLTVGSAAVVDAQQLRQLIKSSVLDGQAVSATWRVQRKETVLELLVTPELKREGEWLIGKLGAYVGARPEVVLIQYGAAAGLWRGMVQTWEVSSLTLKMMGKMLIGEASLKNLSGPLSMAEYAGKSADLGLTSYLVFLALISVSLGVLNLLPLPVLDGGHLMYYLWEGATGKAVPEVWIARLQQVGMFFIFAMMLTALFNDLARLFG